MPTPDRPEAAEPPRTSRRRNRSLTDAAKERPPFDTRLLDRVPLGLVIFRDRKTLFANRPLLDLLGYGSLDAFAAAGGTEAIFPDGPDGWATPSLADGSGRLSLLRRDETKVAVEARLHAVTWGGATALMFSVREYPRAAGDRCRAGERRLAQHDTRTEELEAILDTASDGVVVVDADGRIGKLNRSAEALFGIDGARRGRAALHRPSRRRKPQGGARLSRRARLERRRQRPQ